MFIHFIFLKIISLAASTVRLGSFPLSMKILSVSQQDDSMCFLIIDVQPTLSEKLKAYLLFFFPLLPEFKVHSTINELIVSIDDGNGEQYSEKDVTISFQRDYFKSESYSDHYKDALLNLNHYDYASFGKYFWSAKDTLPFLLDNTDNEKDIERAKLWTLAANEFEKNRLSWLREDFCNYQEIVTAARVLEVVFWGRTTCE